jgi:uncharacterized protein YjbJ (UPF0337 family)
MDKDRIIGSAKQAKGTIKQALGRALGDTKLKVDGKAEELEGRAQNLVGTIKDSTKT